MKRILKCFSTSVYLSILILLIFSVHFVRAQSHLPFQGVPKYAFPKLTSVPPLNTEMPPPVLLGYIFIDSFARTLSEDSVGKFLNFLTFSDTSRIALSYLYQMDDYNPIKYFQYSISDPYGVPYKTAPIFFTHTFGRNISRVYPDSLKVTPLFYSDYILDLWVTDTIPHTDTISAISKRVVGVIGNVLETIKGQVLPPCSGGSSSSADGTGNIAETGLPCIKFEYRPDRIRIPHGASIIKPDSLTVFADGSSWVKTNREYLVFLSYRDLKCSDSLYNYALIEPVYVSSTCASMYPVIGGHVYDPQNDFGFGSNLTPAQFKTALRNKIGQLIHHN
ncbi:MAG: hypothetical protein ABI778_02055 [Ignavibacteriota bacterium]